MISIYIHLLCHTEIDLKSQQPKWDGNGEKNVYDDYKEKDVKWKQGVNKKLIYILFKNSS